MSDQEAPMADIVSMRDCYLAYQEERMLISPFYAPVQSSKLTFLDLPEYILSYIFYLAIEPRDEGLMHKISAGNDMIRQTRNCIPMPKFLLINKYLDAFVRHVWLHQQYTHIYLNSWNDLHPGLLACTDDLTLVAITLDVRQGVREAGQKLVPSAFCAKIRSLVSNMKSIDVLLIRLWHGPGSLGPVCETILNAFAGVKAFKACNISSNLTLDAGLNWQGKFPGIVSARYMKHFVSSVTSLPLNSVPGCRSVKLDAKVPELNFAIWRACSAAKDAEGVQLITTPSSGGDMINKAKSKPKSGARHKKRSTSHEQMDCSHVDTFKDEGLDDSPDVGAEEA